VIVLLQSEDVDPALQLDGTGCSFAGGAAVLVALLVDQSDPRVGSLARTTTLMLTVSPFLTSGGSAIFSTGPRGRSGSRPGSTSIWTPSPLAASACSSAVPRFSLPSDRMTTRRAVSSGKVASASLMAEAKSVYSESTMLSKVVRSLG
jgi:hypothetical protein